MDLNLIPRNFFILVENKKTEGRFIICWEESGNNNGKIAIFFYYTKKGALISFIQSPGELIVQGLKEAVFAETYKLDGKAFFFHGE